MQRSCSFINAEMAEANLFPTYQEHVLRFSHRLLKIHLQAVKTFFILSPVLQVS